MLYVDGQWEGRAQQSWLKEEAGQAVPRGERKRRYLGWVAGVVSWFVLASGDTEMSPTSPASPVAVICDDVTFVAWPLTGQCWCD